MHAMKSQQLPNPEFTFIKAKDVIKLLTHINSFSGAWAKIRTIKKCLGKKKHQGLTVTEFADWEGMDAAKIILTLYSA